MVANPLIERVQEYKRKNQKHKNGDEEKGKKKSYFASG